MIATAHNLGLSIEDLDSISQGIFDSMMIAWLTAEAESKGKIKKKDTFRKASQEDIDAFFGG